VCPRALAAAWAGSLGRMSDADDRKQAGSKRPRRTSPSATAQDGEGDPVAEEPQEPRPCMPCHGTGKVISSLDGHARKVTCPWCRGGGERLTGVDAQEFQQEQAASKRR
jgi:DnaJ-class molecular chaperone